MISLPARSSVFAGRSEELAFLETCVQGLAVGRGACVLVRGGRGMGKTRLVEELRARSSGVAFETHVCAARAEFADFREWLLSVQRPERAPRVLAIEDIDRIGPRALELLEWTLPSASLWIATFAPDDLDAEFEAIVARLHVRGAYELALAPLEDDAMRKIVAGIRIGGRRIARTAAARLVELAAGNPSLANEIARTLAETPDRSDDPPIPVALRAQARTMLQRLDAASERIVMIASLTQRPFDVAFLARTAGCSQPEVVEAMQEATLAGLTCELAQERFVFNHPLLREAVRAEATATWARPFHRRFAAALVAAGEPEAIEEAARHFEAAGDAGNAVACSERAARLFLEHGAFADAARNYRRIVRLREPGDPQWLDASFELGSALRRGGFEDEATSVFEAILRDGANQLNAERRAIALAEVMHLAYGNGQAERVGELAREILGMDLPASSLVKSETLVRLAGFACGDGRFEEAVELLARIPRKPEPSLSIRARMHQQQGCALAGLNDFETGLPHFRRGLRVARQSGDVALFVQLAANFGHHALANGRNELAFAWLERAYRSAQRTNSETRMHLAIATYATALNRVGRLAESCDLLASVDVPGSDAGGIHGYFVAVPMLEAGSMTERRSLVAAAMEVPFVEYAMRSGEAQRIAPVAAVVAMHDWCTGETQRARKLLHDAFARVRHSTRNPWFCVMIAKCGEMRDAGAARAMLLRDIGRETAIDAFVDLFDAFAARRRGRNALATRHGERAAEQFARLGWPFFEAQALEVGGRHEAALRIYDRIGDVRDARILRASIRPSRGGVGAHAVALTGREREVVALAAQGMASKEIAARLAIGVRTVEHHLQVVYGKLGIRSRWQIPLDVAQHP